jgi:hypothetical protein
MSDLTEAGPGAVAMHAVNNARQLLLLPEQDLARVAELLAPVPDLILRQQTYIERVEARNTALNEALIDANTRLAAASRQTEQLLIRASIRLQGETEDFNSIRSIRDALDPTAAPIVDRIHARFNPNAAVAAGSR